MCGDSLSKLTGGVVVIHRGLVSLRSLCPASTWAEERVVFVLLEALFVLGQKKRQVSVAPKNVSVDTLYCFHLYYCVTLPLTHYYLEWGMSP